MHTFLLLDIKLGYENDQFRKYEYERKIQVITSIFRLKWRFYTILVLWIEKNIFPHIHNLKKRLFVKKKIFDFFWKNWLFWQVPTYVKLFFVDRHAERHDWSSDSSEPSRKMPWRRRHEIAVTSRAGALVLKFQHKIYKNWTLSNKIDFRLEINWTN